MFTGIIKSVGRVAKIKALDGGKELSISTELASKLDVDQSISVNGVCHTVTECNGEQFTVQSVEETLRKTNIGGLSEGDPVNLERSLRPDQLLDGHMVQGHVDATGVIVDIEKEGTDYLFTIEYPEKDTSLIVGRGSVSVDGISLTVAQEEDNTFQVAIIPYTYNNTNLGNKEVGDSVNLEYDILGKYVLKYLKEREG